MCAKLLMSVITSQILVHIYRRPAGIIPQEIIFCIIHINLIMLVVMHLHNVSPKYLISPSPFLFLPHVLFSAWTLSSCLEFYALGQL
jgi:hypothetical protein